jgi:pimeloyl-ACP methyl ester carboxylesterase
MTQKTLVHPADIHGFSCLMVEATLGLIDLVETMHANIAYAPGVLGPSTSVATHGITGLVYRSIRGITRLTGSGLDAVLGQLIPLFGKPGSSPEREGLLAALNGVLGDYLASSNNPLMIPMGMRRDGQPLDLTASSLARAIPQPRNTILLLVHGLCLSDVQWQWKGHDHGAHLASDLGYTPIYLHYNTGLHISTNGRAFAVMIEALLRHWPVPVEQLVIVGHSMGGLVTRSACHYGALAGHAWLRRLHTIVFLGTPHHGAPLERVGNWVNVMLGANPYTAAFARLGKVRSAGITDLRYGNLLNEDWADRDRFAHVSDQRRSVPLPGSARCYTIAATTGKTAGDMRGQLLGDGLVRLHSALGYHVNPSLAVPFPESQQWIGYDMNHLDLLHRREVYEQIRHWLTL